MNLLPYTKKGYVIGVSNEFHKLKLFEHYFGHNIHVTYSWFILDKHHTIEKSFKKL